MCTIHGTPCFLEFHCCIRQSYGPYVDEKNIQLVQKIRTSGSCVLQAEALQAAGYVPDQVIILEAPEPILADRAKYRRIDPVTHRIYHLAPGSGALSGAIIPTLPDGSPDEAATPRLIPRGDDSVPNVQHRIATWTKHARSAHQLVKHQSINQSHQYQSSDCGTHSACV